MTTGRHIPQGDSSVGADTDTGGDTVSGAVSGRVSPASVSPAALVPMSAATRAGHAVAEAARELWLHPDRLLHAMWHGKPESMAEHRAYMKSRAWVPPGMGGRPEKAVIGAGLFYHLFIGRPLKAAAKTVDGAADRPLRLAALAIPVIVLLVLLAVL